MSNFASGYVKYINHLEQINDAAVSCPQRMIAEVEDAYHDHLENIARNITSHHRQVRVIMLSGPSSSGKTTTAHLLRDYLTAFGANTTIVSLDDFYRPNCREGSLTMNPSRPWMKRRSRAAFWTSSPPGSSLCPPIISPWAARRGSCGAISWAPRIWSL